MAIAVSIQWVNKLLFTSLDIDFVVPISMLLGTTPDEHLRLVEPAVVGDNIVVHEQPVISVSVRDVQSGDATLWSSPSVEENKPVSRWIVEDVI
ncbi:hypothetical protein [Natrialba chahannaoensis]|uniref:hypothetical protein n=1 Tax=Natrialba chahannaoensis TaxID=68911 RepID=UPI0013763239|nr:hypothetical protein [Natrialba chahannaoensis]